METFHPRGEVLVLPNAVQGAGTLVLPWTWVMGHGDDRCEHCSHPAPFPPARRLCGSRRCQGIPPSAQTVLGGLTCSPEVQPHRSREVPGEGVRGSAGSAGSKQRQEKGFWIQPPQMAHGKPGVTAKLTGSKAAKPWGRMWGRQWQW